MEFFSVIKYKLGWICIEATENYVKAIKFCKTKPDNELNSNEVLQECASKINLYLEGRLKKVDCPVRLNGTEFQKLVWYKTMQIPYGQVITYSQLARKIGKPRAVRAVANALGANKLPVIIPCHRVIRSDGTLGGFSAGVEVKKFLLNLENVTF